MLAAIDLALPCPTWSAGRLWLLRVGYYKLTRPKMRADDWVWIVDHSVQLGATKCLVILGVRLSALPPAGQCLSHEDVEPIELLPVEHSDGKVVYQQLEQAAEKTGVPRAIVGDHGSDLRAGVSQFCQQHSETSEIYDIKHKTAAILKRELEHDEAWQAFTQLAGRAKSQVQQTALAALAPPNQRAKARYMNMEILVKWGQAMLAFLNNQQASSIHIFDLEQVQKKLGWVMDFQSQIKEWAELFQIIATTESFVRRQGLYRGAHLELEKCLRQPTHTERVQRIRRELIAFVAEEAAKARPKERLVGSSEVIESVLGKMKRLEQDQAKSGFTGLLLSLGAMVSSTTKKVVQQALETVPTKEVLAWCEETLRQSVQAKRREAFASRDRAEQKWDQLLEPT